MATALKNLSDYNPEQIPSAAKMRFAIVVAEWNPQITNALAQGAIDALKKNGATEANIDVYPVPGTFELTYGAAAVMLKSNVDAIICLGCVIQGETRHYDFICQGVTQGITQLNTVGTVPVIFGVLTTDNLQQALDRAGGKHGNKGVEAAVTAIKMVAFNKSLK
jgi:6,7-dimethyl-8-ribityllumazine synthase